MSKPPVLYYLFMALISLSACNPTGKSGSWTDMDKASATMDSIYKYYGSSHTPLLRETYPDDNHYSATYLSGEDHNTGKHRYSYLWPYSGTFSAIVAMYETSGDPAILEILRTQTLPGLEEYFDTARQPAAYSSYIVSQPVADRFYDDNIWIGIDFADLYSVTGEKQYLDRATLIWEFIRSGTDEHLGGGIYWCEQKKESKNTCSNAPGSVYALKLFKATGDSLYFYEGKELYEWTRKHLRDPEDKLYFDNIKMDGRIGKSKYAYNSGQMLQSASLLYELTGNSRYLEDAKELAEACYQHFFEDFTSPDGRHIRLIKKGNTWFTAVMMRGFCEFYRLYNDRTYLDAYKESLDYIWEHARSPQGLFGSDWSGDQEEEKKWLLTQAAMAEMYSRMAKIKN